jgi:hypothetical protein
MVTIRAYTKNSNQILQKKTWVKNPLLLESVKEILSFPTCQNRNIGFIFIHRIQAVCDNFLNIGTDILLPLLTSTIACSIYSFAEFLVRNPIAAP